MGPKGTQSLKSSLALNGAKHIMLDPAKVQWLHPPKTGTSFANVLISRFCDLPKDASLDNFDCKDRKQSRLIPEFMDQYQSHCSSGFKLYPEHTPVNGDVAYDWMQHQGHWMIMVRQPEQRIMSQYYHKKECAAEFHIPAKTLALQHAGCVVKMLNGYECRVERQVSDEMLSIAKHRIDSGFAFVGITEQWALSVCLFHAMFGGNCHSREFSNTRQGTHSASKGYNTSVLEGFVDAKDRALYRHAKQIFESRLEKYNVNSRRCAAEICRAAPDAFR